MNIERTLEDGERIDLGGITLETVLTPGHSPGHLSFYIPEHGLLFSGDVDLTPFGPFYGHDFADLGDFIDSIDRLRNLDARMVVTGHSGPFTENLKKRFDNYEAVIYEREREILKYLDRPRALEFFHGRNIVYRKYYENDPYIDLTKWIELVHVEKHLHYLAKTDRVMQDPDSKMWLK
ncbi:MAG: MBL fold metallo-hydrolase [Deltaproteobacteria bacterium]|nr:MBL fold metallo-hydrolase [Deltaproteobacteria bacterium]